MANQIIRIVVVTALSFGVCFVNRASACCPASPSGVPVVNADQTVIIVWDAATKTEHFIRRASFKGAADNFGFLIPTPSQPVLDESGNEAFALLENRTAPEIHNLPHSGGGMGCGCSAEREPEGSAKPAVNVLEEKTVAGFNAVVLETDSATALITWLKANGYAFSPEVEAWAKPYVEMHWKITALKVVKADGNKNPDVTASALRMSFKTDRPLFPYREPDSTAPVATLGAKKRLLRIYFLGEARYQGELTPQTSWTGKVAWANKINSDDRKMILTRLNLPDTTSPPNWWLTEFEDAWPYKIAPADLYFSPSADASTVKRPPIFVYVSPGPASDLPLYAIVAIVLIPRLFRKGREKE